MLAILMTYGQMGPISHQDWGNLAAHIGSNRAETGNDQFGAPRWARNPRRARRKAAAALGERPPLPLGEKLRLPLGERLPLPLGERLPLRWVKGRRCRWVKGCRWLGEITAAAP
jgi:hypothetical protein